ncbi:M23 family metallopeptidase [Streptomyces sp. NPDC052042]|uniref:M23 family metallopeptidase n=1 Tax=Streptomyces sp. NPDC052042 TaxID=3365683 RepID=UPI0037D4965F
MPTALKALWRWHGPVFGVGALCVLANGRGLGPLWYTGVVLLVVGGLMRWTLGRSQRPRGERPAVPVGVPVTGRWMVLNGPATKVPSHVHSHAQTYAVDLKHDPAPAQDGADVPAPPPFNWLVPFGRRPRHYSSFGAPVLAVADGVVVTTASKQRDHLSRTSLPGLAYLYLEGFVRTLGRPRHLLGNHVVMDLGDGVYAVYAHLRRGSLRVAAGDRVAVGQEIATCGNSGNSSEPHLHFQLMDGSDVMTARGLPFAWRYLDDDGRRRTGVPEDFAHVVADRDGHLADPDGRVTGPEGRVAGPEGRVAGPVGRVADRDGRVASGRDEPEPGGGAVQGRDIRTR